MRYYKTTNPDGTLGTLTHSEINSIGGQEIFKSEYNNVRVGLRIFQEGIDPEVIKTQSWWK